MIHLNILMIILSFVSATTFAQNHPPMETEEDFHRAMEELSNWGRWGAEDELGAANLITPEKRLEAVALVTEGITVSETKSQPRTRQKWLLIALAAGSGLLSILSNSGVGIWPLAWVAWIPLLLALKEVKTWKSAFLLGYVNGLIQYLGTLYWIALLAPFAETGNIFTNWLTTGIGYLAMSGYLSLYPAVFCLSFLLTWQRPRRNSTGFIPRSLVIFQLAAVWTGLEWISEWMMSGFPWMSIGYTQWQNLPVIQIASVFGVHGVSFILMLFNWGVAKW